MPPKKKASTSSAPVGKKAASSVPAAPTAAMSSAPPAATDGEFPYLVQWTSIDPRTNTPTPYTDADNRNIERAYKKGDAEFAVFLGGNKFKIVFAEMLQYNASGGSRQVLRHSDEPEPKVVIPDLDTPLKTTVLNMVEKVDKAVELIEKNEAVANFKLPADAFGDPRAMVGVFEIILATMRQDRYKTRYGFRKDNDEPILKIQFGAPVPSYYANVKNQSIFHRKYLSLLGLRNLVRYGPEIFFEMREKQFSGCMEDYRDKTGPHKMRYFTGNAVDLDTTVMRCHDSSSVNAINAYRRKQGLKPFADGNELASSDEGKMIAVQQAKSLIDDFVARFKLSPAQVQQRRLDLNESSTDVHVAGDNSDRGKYPMWMYQNVGVVTFHANVPSMADVYGALLRAPFHLAKAFVMVHTQSKSPEELQKGLDEFFEDGVADSCFNAKWKAIEEFVGSRQTLGTIDDELNKLQASRQDLFNADFFDKDEDGTQELVAMTRLTLEAKLEAIDPKTKTKRAVTKYDVEAWHRRRNGLPDPQEAK